MANVDFDLAPFGASPTSPNAVSLNLSRLATDTDETERQMTALVETTLGDIAGLLGTNRYYRRESHQEDAHGTSPRPSLPFSPDAEAARAFAAANGITVAVPSGATSAAPPPPPAPRSVSFQEDSAASAGAPQVRALCWQLEQARDLVRRLDSERRFYRQRALRQQKDLDHASEEKLAISVRASEGHRLSLDAEGQLNQARAHIRGMETTIDCQAEELLALRRFVRSLPPLYAQAYDTLQEDGQAAAAPLNDALKLVPDRRFEEAFRDKMDLIGFKRRCQRARAACEAASARYEALRMANADTDAHTSSAGTRAVASVNEALTVDSAVPSPSSYAMPTATALLQQRRRSSVLDFPVNVPFSPATPHDVEIKSLIFHSAFAEPLMEARDGLLRVSTRLKLAEENGLHSLYSLFGDALRRLAAADRPLLQKTFEKQMDALQRAQRELLFQLVAYVNTAAVDITKTEKKLRERSGSGSGGALGARRSCHDVACMAADTSMEDYRLHQLETRLQQKELRLLEERGEAEKKVATLAVDLEQQQTQTLSILESLEELERSVAASTRLAMRHQRTGADVVERVPKDPFRVAVSAQPLRAQDLNDARLLAKVAESVDVTVGCLRQLTNLTAPVLPDKATGSCDDHSDADAATRTGNTDKKRKKKLSLPSRRTSDSLGWSGATRNRSRSRTRNAAAKGTHTPTPRRGTAQEDFLASTLPEFSQGRRHTLPAVPTTSRSSGQGSSGCVPTPPSISLAAKPRGQAPRRASASTSLELEPLETVPAVLSPIEGAAVGGAARLSDAQGALTPLSVNQSDSRRSSGAPVVLHTAKRHTTGVAPIDGLSPAPEQVSAGAVPETEEPRAHSHARESGAKSREASLAPVAIVNIELFRGGEGSPSKD